jgi:hypothetical protein
MLTKREQLLIAMKSHETPTGECAEVLGVSRQMVLKMLRKIYARYKPSEVDALMRIEWMRYKPKKQHAKKH